MERSGESDATKDACSEGSNAVGRFPLFMLRDCLRDSDSQLFCIESASEFEASPRCVCGTHCVQLT